jgi:Fe-S-cluster containining protein
VSEAAWERVRAVPGNANLRTLICPLLDPTTKLCSVYTERPLVCRAFSAIGDWKNCYPELAGSQTVKTPSSPLVAAGTYLTSQPRTVLLDELRRACPTPAVREIFVDSVLGNDETGDGSREKPFATPSRAIFS